MNNFLKAIAEKLYNTGSNDMVDYCLVFPNRRAGLYFNMYLAELAQKPVWSPVIYTISDLMVKLSGIQPGDEMSLIFELYHTYKRIKKSDEGFDSFFYWGEVMLADFDDIDKNLVNTADLFQNLADIKEIENTFDYLTEDQINAIRSFWLSFNPGKYSDHQQEFISTWSILDTIYSEYKKGLAERKTGYEGMIYRQVADMLSENNAGLKFNKFIFIGFNALNRSEEKLFSFLKSMQKAEFYWDYDNYYISDKANEAGFFLRSNLKNYPHSAIDCSFSQLTSRDKKIEIISAPSNVSQAKIIYNLLSDLGCNNCGPEHTVVVLPDESLLMPVLYSIPPEVGGINITMGYPLKHSSAFSLVENLAELHKSAKQGQDGKQLFYHRNVLSVLNHPLVSDASHEASRKIAGEITLQNKIYISVEEFYNIDVLSEIFVKINDFNTFTGYLLKLLHFFFGRTGMNEGGSNSMIQQEFIYNVYLSVKRLQVLLDEWDINPGFETCLKLLKKILFPLRIPFTGEPLAGLQVMGILETRAIDFDNVIILSMNEGIFPSTAHQPSFIPHNLRRGFGMTTTEHRDAMSAYYFYRLVQRAKNVYLVYNTQSEGIKTGEMSRFLYQLKYEPAFRINEKNLNFQISFDTVNEIIINKNPEIIKKLESLTGSQDNNAYLSPTAINTWIDCSLKFYFQYIAGITEYEQIREEIDPPVFGNILHKTLNSIYSVITSKKITTTVLERLLKNVAYIEDRLLDAFNTEFFSNRIKSKDLLAGRNILIFEVLRKYLIRIIEMDKSLAPFEIDELEKKFVISLNTGNNGKTRHVNIGGRIDRIDKIQNTYRIIDYKTGNADTRFPDVASLFDNALDNRNKAALQSLMYAMILSRNYKSVIPVVPGLYILKELYRPGFDYRLEYKSDGKYYAALKDYMILASEFENHLVNTLNDIFSNNTSFRQTTNIYLCRYCMYRSICGK
jgi:hypothetical protein